MAKIDPLNDLANLASETTAVQTINANNDKVVVAVEKTLSRDGSTPNDMETSLDMGGFRVINVGAPIDPNDSVRFQDIGNITPQVLADIEAAADNAADAQTAATAAAASAVLAASYIGSATSAQQWTTSRSLTLTGDVAGVSAPFNGTANVSFSVTISSGAVDSSKMAVGAAVNNIGYIPLNKAGDTLTGNLRNSYVPTALAGDEVGFRILPFVEQNTDYTFIMKDAGFLYAHNNGSPHTWIVPTNTTCAFPVGTSIVLRGQGAGAVSLTPQDGTVTLRKAGSGTSGTVVLSQWGLATLIKEGTNFWVVTGVGIT